MRLIDADKLLYDKNISAYPAFMENLADISDLKDIVNECETVDAQPVVHAKWKDAVSIWGFNVCSECYAVYEHKTNYCPHCGAKMDAGDD